MKRSVKIFSVVVFMALIAALMISFKPQWVQAQPTLTQKTPDSFADLAEQLLPTVVNISTTQKVVEYPNQRAMPFPEFPGFPEGHPFNDLFREFFDDRMFQPFMQPNQNQTPGQERAEPREFNRPNSLGSGFIIDAKNGYVVTNNHVIAGADEIKVILQDDTTLDAELVGTDEKTDLAVLKVKSDVPLTAARWGNSDSMRVGDWVMAIGNPFGLGGTVTAGIISARQRDIHAGPYDDFIQTDASINRGNSGGPMFNLNGEVIGINTAIYSPSGGSVGIGFAIPSAMAETVVKQIIDYGRTRRGWLGVRFQSVTPEIAESLGLKEDQGGVLVATVEKDSPAAKAGLKPGDVIINYDGVAIQDMRRLPRLVADSEINKPKPVTLWRDGKAMNVTITIGEMPEDEKKDAQKKDDKTEQSNDAVTGLGLTVAPLNDTLRKLYSIEDGQTGIIITQVDETSQAAARRVTAGAVILEINQQKIASVKDFETVLAGAKKAGKTSVLLLINQNGTIRFVALPLST